MDKSIEVVLILVVLFVTALIVFSMVTGEADGFMDFTDNQTSNSQCDLWKTQEESPIQSPPQEACDSNECDISDCG